MLECRDGTNFTHSHWTHFGKDGIKPILLIDFDHTITTRCLACKKGLEGDTVQEGTHQAVTELQKYFQIWIFTGCADLLPNYKNPKQYQRSIKDIEDILESNGIPYDRILQTKPPAMFLIDDRAIHHKSWSETMGEINRRLSK